MNFKIKPPGKEEIYSLYWKEGLSQNEIAEKYNVARHTIQKWMYFYKIPRRPKGFTTKRMREKISLIQKGKRHSPKTEFKPKIIIPPEDLKELYINEELSMTKIGDIYGLSKKGIKRLLKKYNISIRSTRDEYEELRIKNLKGYMNRPEIKKLYRKKAKEILSKPESRKKNLKALMKRPTRLEENFIKIINKNKLPYKYVGDGEFILGGKCPDFLNCDGKKQVIEIFGRVFHDPKKTFKKEIPHHQTEKGTIEHYEKYGFKCLIIWEEELTNENKILAKLEGVNWQ